MVDAKPRFSVLQLNCANPAQSLSKPCMGIAKLVRTDKIERARRALNFVLSDMTGAIKTCPRSGNAVLQGKDLAFSLI